MTKTILLVLIIITSICGCKKKSSTSSSTLPTEQVTCFFEAQNAGVKGRFLYCAKTQQEANNKAIEYRDAGIFTITEKQSTCDKCQ